MSHCCCIVMLEDGFHDDMGTEGRVGLLLAPYDEGLPMAPYVDMSAREIADRASDATGSCRALVGDDALCDRAACGDRHAIREVARRMCDLVDDMGNAYTTRNPNGRWDYWRIDGSWTGGAEEFRSDDVPAAIDRVSPSVVTPDGVWHEPDGGVIDYGLTPSEAIRRYPGCTCVVVDCHD